MTKIFALQLAIVAFSTAFCSAEAQTIKPEPIALPGSQFPVSPDVLNKQIAVNDIPALRSHGWRLWSGLTANSGHVYEGRPLPIWETWLSEEEAFSKLSQVMASEQVRVLRPFSRLSQLRHQAFEASRGFSEQLATDSDKTRLLAFVKLSPDAAEFVMSPHEMPGGEKSIGYNNKSDLQNLNDYFNQHSTPTVDRKIADFPAKAIDLKIVFLPIKAQGLTAIPVWDGPLSSSNPERPTSDTWTKCVAVDPSNLKSGTAAVECNGAQIQAEIVRLNRFYSIRLDAARAAAVSEALNLSGASALVEGDYQVAVAMHVTTKEIANWTWQTFWWQNGKNPPNKFPGSIDDMPPPSVLTGAWRNYAMCVADFVVVPVNDPKGGPVVCFNPYLEPGLSEGISSNCMSCHARATVAGVRYPTTYHPNGWIDPADQIFAAQTKTDFVWAVQNSGFSQ